MKKPLHVYVLFDFILYRIVKVYSSRAMANRAQDKYVSKQIGDQEFIHNNTAVLKFSVAGAVLYDHYMDMSVLDIHKD